MPASPTRRIVAAPRPPELASARRFPLVATIAPVVVSLVLFAVTRSAFTLVFAALGPVVALGTLADSAWHRRRTAARERARFASELQRADRDLDDAHDAERAELDREFPRARALLADSGPVPSRWRRSRAPVDDLITGVRLGSGEMPSSVVIEHTGPARGIESDERLAELFARAQSLARAPITARISTRITIVGNAVHATAAARGILLQLAAGYSPATTTIVAPGDPTWDWLNALPHATTRDTSVTRIEFVTNGGSLSVAIAASAWDVSPDSDVVIELTDQGTARVAEGVVTGLRETFRAEFLGLESATRIAASLAARAEPMPGASAIPTEVDFASMPRAASTDSLAAAIGIGPSGPVMVDLVRDGPHAIVGGTTGSGKSELLTTWALAMAAERSPAAVTFLFVDFKGGAAFEPLAELPHCVGIITDLDVDQSLRALASLAAELRFRERELAKHGLKSIDESGAQPPFPRLVVMVDEYAALIETHSSLHGVFADIAARGRSLGVHLVLCTQRPAGVVRDGILANCALRMSLRVLTAADSTSLIGADGAAALTSAPAGRALLSLGGAPPTSVQVAHSSASDAASVRRRWGSAEPARAPWLPPLPTRVPVDVLADHLSGDGIPFALEDLPERQAQEFAEYRPEIHGSLLVVGTAGSGKSGVLAALLAAPSKLRVRQLPGDAPRLWDALAALARDAPESGSGDDNGFGSARVLLLDDVDLVVSSADDLYQQALLDSLHGLLRAGRASGIYLVLTVQRVNGAIQSLAALCGSVLVLRMPSQQEHVLAGGTVGDYRAGAVPGSGVWHGNRLQVLDAPAPRDAVASLVTTELTLDADALVVVSTDPERFADRLRAAVPTRAVTVLGHDRFNPSVDEPPAIIGTDLPHVVADPESWQGHWSSFVVALRSGDVLFDGCSPVEIRTLTRTRELPPPFPPGERPLWLRASNGQFTRARLPS